MKSAAILFVLITIILICKPHRALSSDVEIGSLVLNKTITRIGNEFYEAFTDRWQPPLEVGPLHVEISEAPSARWGSILAIYVGGRRYFITRLSTRARNIEDVAADAVKEVTVSLIKEYLIKQQNEENGDLVGDGL